MARSIPKLGALVVAVVAAALVASSVWLDESGAVNLGELAGADEVVVAAEAAEYPVFDDERVLVRSMTLAGETLLSITPPFPSRVTFDFVVPRSGVLELSTALVMMQQVERARVRYTVRVASDGETRVAFDEVRTIDDANRWQPVRVELGEWSNRDISLTLVTQPDPGPRDVSWAGRVQVVWGGASVRAGGAPKAATDATLAWLEGRALALGANPVERLSLLRYGANLLVAGLASLVVGWVYRRFASDGGSGGLTRGFVIFTLTATFVVAVLRSSIALSLGLLGALSILRFRTPVRTAEQLLGLLVCVAVALACGTDQALLAAVAVAVFVAVMVLRRFRRPETTERFFLTAAGPTSAVSGETGVLDRVEAIGCSSTVESFDVVGGEVRVRARVELETSTEAAKVVAALRTELPGFRISFESSGGA